jgi:Poly-beta-hydroxybutyrate polymerase N terminal
MMLRDDCDVRSRMLAAVSAVPPAAAADLKPCVAVSDGIAPPSFDTYDRFARAMTARFTQGVSPHTQYAAWLDWASHLVRAPGRQLELWLEAANTHARFAQFATGIAIKDGAEARFPARRNDRRFDDPR